MHSCDTIAVFKFAAIGVQLFCSMMCWLGIHTFWQLGRLECAIPPFTCHHAIESLIFSWILSLALIIVSIILTWVCLGRLLPPAAKTTIGFYGVLFGQGLFLVSRIFAATQDAWCCFDISFEVPKLFFMFVSFIAYMIVFTFDIVAWLCR